MGDAGDAVGDGAWWVPDVASLDDLPVALFLAVGALILVVVLIPLLLFGIEAIAAPFAPGLRSS
jgi:hypothetical protein